jgi:cephalosporin hydroxylase
MTLSSQEQTFQEENRQDIVAMGADQEFRALSDAWMTESVRHRYSYHFRWMGRPIIQYPQDMIALQELIWDLQPDCVVETGVAHGGSLIFYASLLELLGGDRQVLGIDIEIRPHNRTAIEAHPMFRRISLLEGSSIDPTVFAQVQSFVKGKQRVLVVLDSNHAHDHVLEELRLYSQLVQPGSYVVVLDTVVEDLPAGMTQNRPWDKGSNPKTAVWEFLRESQRFELDTAMAHKLMITTAPDGFLKCVGDAQGGSMEPFGGV